MSENIDDLTYMTKEIMNRLGIKIRPNVYLDDPISFTFDDFKNKGNIGANFVVTNAIYPNDSASLRFYKKPEIVMKKFFYERLKKGIKKDTSNYFFYILGINIIIHELTHYLQLTYPSTEYADSLDFSTLEKRREYIKRPSEFEAYAVGYYYFLYYFRRPLLERIVISDLKNVIKMKIIINEADKLMYPASGEIFPDISH